MDRREADLANGALRGSAARRPPRFALPALIALVTLALLAVALFFHPVGDYHAESDFYGGYRDGALLVRHGHLDPARYIVVGPVYETLLAAIGAAGGDLYTLAKLMSVAAACATLVAWSGMLAIAAGEWAAIAIVALLAVNPTFARYGYSACTDMPALALASLSLLRLTRAPSRARGRPGRALLVAGALAALAALTRYSAALLLPAGLAAIALAPPQGLKRARAALMFTAGFALPAAPWLAYSAARGVVPGVALFRYFGFYAGTEGGAAIQDVNPAVPGALEGYHSLAQLMRSDPGGLLLRALSNIPAHLALDARELLGWPAALLALAGLGLIVARRRDARFLAPVWLLGALFVLAFAPVFYSQRYLLPLAPIELSLAAVALAAPYPLAAIPVAIVVLGLGAKSSLDQQREVRRLLPVEVKEAGRALAASAAPGDQVMSRKGHIGYYSGLPVVPFPRVSSLAELASAARAAHATFLYYSWYEARLRPEFGWLLDTTAVVPGLERIAFTPRKASVVFRIGSGFGRDPDWLADPWLKRLHESRALVDVLPERYTAPYRLALAVDALERGAPQVALELCAQAERYVPDEPLLWQTRGRALLDLGRFEDAAKAFEHALQYAPEDAATREALKLARERAAGAGPKPH